MKGSKVITMQEAVEALDAGKLQWNYGHGEWKTIRRDPQQRSYPRNPERISVIIEPSQAMLKVGATGGLADGLDSSELRTLAKFYRIVS